MGIPESVTHMEPVLLFSVFTKDGEKKGVYYALQFGVVMQDATTEGSVVELAKLLRKHGIDKYEPGVIDPGCLSMECVIHSISEWMVMDNCDSDGDEYSEGEDEDEDE